MLKPGCLHYPLVRLRPATLSDLEEMIEIERSSFGEQSYRRELIEQLLTDRGFHNVIVEEEGRKVGYATFFEDARRKRARLVTIAVDSGVIGIGEWPGHARLPGTGDGERSACARCRWRSGMANDAGEEPLPLHRVPDRGHVPDYYGKGKDAFYMEKPIEGRS